MKRLLIFAVTCICAVQVTKSEKFAKGLDLKRFSIAYEDECLPGGPIPMCIDACKGATCPSHPDAVCMINICGNCDQIWFKSKRSGRREEVPECKQD